MKTTESLQTLPPQNKLEEYSSTQSFYFINMRVTERVKLMENLFQILGWRLPYHITAQCFAGVSYKNFPVILPKWSTISYDVIDNCAQVISEITPQSIGLSRQFPSYDLIGQWPFRSFPEFADLSITTVLYPVSIIGNQKGDSQNRTMCVRKPSEFPSKHTRIWLEIFLIKLRISPRYISSRREWISRLKRKYSVLTGPVTLFGWRGLASSFYPAKTVVTADHVNEWIFRYFDRNRQVILKLNLEYECKTEDNVVCRRQG